MKPQRDGRVRCSAWLGGVVILMKRMQSIGVCLLRASNRPTANATKPRLSNRQAARLRRLTLSLLDGPGTRRNLWQRILAAIPLAWRPDSSSATFLRRRNARTPSQQTWTARPSSHKSSSEPPALGRAAESHQESECATYLADVLLRAACGTHHTTDQEWRTKAYSVTPPNDPSSATRPTGGAS